MAPSIAGDSTGDQLVNDIKSSLDAIYNNKATVGGQRMHAVSPAKLEQLERRIERALARQGENNASPSALIAMQEQVSELRKENDNLNLRLKDAIKMESETLAARNRAAAALVDAQREAEESKLSHGKEKALLTSQMAKATADLKEAKAAIRSPEAKFDPAAALVLQTASDEAVKQVKELNSKLAAVNRELGSRQTLLNKAQEDLKQQTALLDNAKAATAHLKNALHAGNNEGTELVFSPAIEALLGKDACKVLQQWHDIAFDNVKDRAFVGMKALSHHKNGLLSAIGKMFHFVYEWCKKQTMSARKALVPWVDMVVQDLLAAKLKTVAFYRDELKKLQVIVVEEKAKQSKQHSGGKKSSGSEDTWFSDMWFYGYAIVLRIRRRVAPPAKRVKWGLFGGVKAAGAWFWGMTKFQVSFYHELITKGEFMPEGGETFTAFDAVWPAVVSAYWSAWPLEYRPLPKTEDVFEVPEDEAPEAKPL